MRYKVSVIFIEALIISGPTVIPTILSGFHGTLNYSATSKTLNTFLCTFGSSGITSFFNAGSQTWKKCLYLASQYAAMMFGSYTCGSNSQAWLSHRQVILPPQPFGPSGNAMVATPSFNIYTSVSITTVLPCIIALDNGANTTNLPLSNTVLWDGDFW